MMMARNRTSPAEADLGYMRQSSVSLVQIDCALSHIIVAVASVVLQATLSILRGVGVPAAYHVCISLV